MVLYHLSKSSPAQGFTSLFPLSSIGRLIAAFFYQLIEIEMDKLQSLIAKHEGFRASAYEDSEGYLTIGYGRMIDKRLGGGITEAEAEGMLVKDITTATSELYSFPWFKELDDVRKAVVVNMAFNLGISRFRLFKNTIWYLSQGLYTETSIEMLDSKWAEQVGDRAIELSRMMKTGEWG